MAGFKMFVYRLMVVAVCVGIGSGVLLGAYSCGDAAMAVEHAIVGS